MANREGLATNEQYYIFIQIIQEILSTFEFDRQYIYREYAKWINLKTNESDKKNKIIDSVNKQKSENDSSYRENEDEYSKTSSPYSHISKLFPILILNLFPYCSTATGTIMALLFLAISTIPQ